MPNNRREQGYSTGTGLVYVFNLIIGTGALALPGAVAKAGILPGVLLITVLGLASYITVSFIVETLAAANAVGRQRTLQVQYDNVDTEDETGEGRPLTEAEPELFEIRDKFEMSELANALLSRPAKLVVITSLVVYLLGDLSIYCAVISLSLVHSTCSSPSNVSCNGTIPDEIPCWPSHPLTRIDMYRIYVCIIVCVMSPFVFMNIQKTKWLQMFTSFTRWLAFLIMIGWSIERLVNYGRYGFPAVVNIYAVPTMFGACVYSFMCQHSIPGLVQPVANKQIFVKTLSLNYGIIVIFYLLLSMTAVFTFHDVADLYTLNFWRLTCGYNPSTTVLFLNYFLALFPVFTLSTSYPIIAVTLRNNLREIIGDGGFYSLLIPLSTLIVPATLALAIPNIQLLVGVVGSYAGAAMQYIAPALLVSAARSRTLGSPPNPFKSPFQSQYWITGVYAWASICLGLITINYISYAIQLQLSWFY